MKCTVLSGVGESTHTHINVEGFFLFYLLPSPLYSPKQTPQVINSSATSWTELGFKPKPQTRNWRNPKQIMLSKTKQNKTKKQHTCFKPASQVRTSFCFLFKKNTAYIVRLYLWGILKWSESKVLGLCYTSESIKLLQPHFHCASNLSPFPKCCPFMWRNPNPIKWLCREWEPKSSYLSISFSYHFVPLSLCYMTWTQ